MLLVLFHLIIPSFLRQDFSVGLQPVLELDLVEADFKTQRDPPVFAFRVLGLKVSFTILRNLAMFSEQGMVSSFLWSLSK